MQRTLVSTSANLFVYGVHCLKQSNRKSNIVIIVQLLYSVTVLCFMLVQLKCAHSHQLCYVVGLSVFLCHAANVPFGTSATTCMGSNQYTLPGDITCRTCPANSITSATKDGCTCVNGYAPKQGTTSQSGNLTCEICPPGTYARSGSVACTKCAQNLSAVQARPSAPSASLCQVLCLSANGKSGKLQPWRMLRRVPASAP
jgi:hypothetical protein